MTLHDLQELSSRMRQDPGCGDALAGLRRQWRQATDALAWELLAPTAPADILGQAADCLVVLAAIASAHGFTLEETTAAALQKLRQQVTEAVN